MQIDFLTLEEYTALGLEPSNAFGSTDFLRLNRDKCQRVIAAVGDGRVGIVFGENDGVLCAPWSAPYLSLQSVNDCSVGEIREFGYNLRESLGNRKTRLIFPPKIYNGPEKNLLEGVLRHDDIVLADTSFYIPLAESEGEKGWNKSARRNLKRGQEAGLKAERSDDFRECYNLIANHHASLGYNMAMTAEAVYDTSRIIPIDFWIVRLEGHAVAAMYCYRVRRDIVQVISSGDTPRGREVGAAMFMERSIIDHYRSELVEKKGIKDAILDHGPTSVNAIQNEGLAAFKKSFGCLMTPKYTIKNY